ncbi:centromere protein J [Amia ocellicauda]|uniref:centromere protein J n=1 Tax=Amia ocellicauda TaxID=2972642 RepID=UPI0034645458
MMSSSAGLQSESNILAQWMPCSSRAGVILNHQLDFVSPLKATWMPEDVNDSFSTQFVPLPASNNSSCLSVDSLLLADAAAKGTSNQEGDTSFDIRALQPTGLNTISSPATSEGLSRELDSMDEAGNTRQRHDFPLMQKLEQLKEWQQQKQEQLKLHQMQQLHRLLEEQQRLLHMVSAQQALTGDPKMPEPAENEEMSAYDASKGLFSLPNVHTYSSVTDCRVPVEQYSLALQAESPEQKADRTLRNSVLGSPCDPDTEEEEDSNATMGQSLSSEGPSSEELHRSSIYEDTPQPRKPRVTQESLLRGPDGDDASQEELLQTGDRPIRPGIGGRKQTFEELLEEQLRLEEQRLRATELEQQGPAPTEEIKDNPKRTFLKRGEGLSRFTKGKAVPVKKPIKTNAKAQPKHVVKNAQQQEPKNTVKNTLQPVQRKTAILNKENNCEHLKSPFNRPEPVSLTRGGQVLKVLGNHIGQTMTQDPARDFRPQNQSKPLGQVAKSQEAVGMKIQGIRVEASQTVCAVPAKTVVKQACLEEKGQCILPQLSTDIPPKDREYSFELSFQRKSEKWETQKQKENIELDEFELLEQAADEISFSSNSSFVLKVLQMDQQEHRGHRLSSTPVKSPQPLKENPETSNKAGQSPLGSQTTRETGGFKQEEAEQAAKSEWDLKDQNNDPEDRGDESSAMDAVCDHSWQSDLDSEDLDDTLQDEKTLQEGKAGPSGLYDSNALQYDRSSYQDGAIKHSFAARECGYGSTDGLTTTGDKGTNNTNGFVFDDDDTWNDFNDTGNVEVEDIPRCPEVAHSESVSPTEKSTSLTDRALKRKVAAVKTAEAKSGDGSEPPPTSDLIAKLFPSLKPKPKPAPSQDTASSNKAAEQASGNNPQSTLLRHRLVELETEIERFRAENSALAVLRQEREKALETLRKEIAETERKKSEELALLEKLKKEEMKKLQKERKVFEKYAAAARAIPDKKEREEMQVLRQQVTSLQEELQRRETRWASTHSRLRQQLDTVSKENSALRDEVRALERLRVQAWRQAEAESGKPNQADASTHGLQRAKSTSPLCAVKSSPPVTKQTQKNSPPVRVNSKGSTLVPSNTSVPEEQVLSEPRRMMLCPQSPSAVPPSTLQTGLLQTMCDVKESVDIQEEITHPDGKIERLLRSGSRLIVFPNGTRKEVLADGKTVKVTFFNGDVKQIMADQRVIYYYADAQTTHTTYPDGLEVLQFPNSQIEKHFPDGRKEIIFPDQTIKNLYPDGQEESIFPDGSIIRVKLDGSKVIEFNNGQREVHTAEYKRREYPDGTVKTVFADGQQETRYTTGRVRVKDKDGNVVMDTRS